MKKFKEFLQENVCVVNGSALTAGSQIMVKVGDNQEKKIIENIDSTTVYFADGSSMSKDQLKDSFLSLVTGTVTEEKCVKEETDMEDEDEIEESITKEKEDTYFEDLVYDFLLSLDEELLTEEQQDMYYEILDELEYDDEDEMEEAIAPVKKKRATGQEKMARKAYYRKNKAKIKQKQTKYRKTSSYKRYQAKADRMSKQGKTSTGKRKTSFY